MSIRRIVPLDQVQWSIASAPAWYLSRDIDWRFRAPSEESVAWLLIDEQHDVATQAATRRWVRHLLSIGAVQALSQVELEFEPDSQRLIVHELVVWRLDADGVWRKRTPVAPDAFLLRQREQQLEQQILNGRVSLVALLEDVRVGDAVDLAWTVEPRDRLLHDVEPELRDHPAQFLHAFLVSERVRSHLPVVVRQRGAELRADGMEYDNLSRTVELKGRQRATFDSRVRSATP